MQKPLADMFLISESDAGNVANGIIKMEHSHFTPCRREHTYLASNEATFHTFAMRFNGGNKRCKLMRLEFHSIRFSDSPKPLDPPARQFTLH